VSKKANGVKVLKGESREAELERRAVDAESRAAGQREVFRETEIGLQTKIAELMGTVANRDQEFVHDVEELDDEDDACPCCAG
jgi:hypothetical protein